MAEDVRGRDTGGGLASDALKELWCWLWAGIAEREQRIWRELSSSRDIRLEKQACAELQEILLRRIPAASDDETEALAQVRLNHELSAAAAAAFEAELRAMHARARSGATGIDVGGNAADAMKLVLNHFLPLVARLRASPRPSDPAPKGTLGPVEAFRFHAWLATTVDQLEDGVSDDGFAGRDAWKEELPSMRMVLGQWVASLAVDRGKTHYFHTSWDRLEQGLGAEPLASFAGWLAAQARPDSDAPAGARGGLERAIRVLADDAGCSAEEHCRSTSAAAPPWTPPLPLPRAYLGGNSRPGDSFSATIVENTPDQDREVPFHQFLAALDRGGAPPPALVVILPKPTPKPKPPAEVSPPSVTWMVSASFFGVKIWSEGEPFPTGAELQERLARAYNGEGVSSTARPKPPPPAPIPSSLPRRMDPPPPPRYVAPPSLESRDQALRKPEPPPAPKEQDRTDRYILTHPRLHRALDGIVVAGGAAFVVGLLCGIALLTWNVDLPYVGEVLTVLILAGMLTAPVLPKDEDGAFIPPPPRARARTPGAPR